MGTIEAEEVLTEDDSTGILHRRVRVPGATDLMTFEGDNLDAAGSYTIRESAVDHPRKCKRCFPVLDTP